MEEGLSDPLNIAKDPLLIKDAQADIAKFDVLVCGECHEVFHFVEEFKSHKSSSCDHQSALLKTCENEEKSQAWGFCLWKNKEIRTSKEKIINSWSIYQRWCKLTQEEKDVWIIGGQTLQSLNKIRLAKLQEVKFKVKREEEADPLALTDKDLLSSLESPPAEPKKNDILKTEIIKPMKLNNDVTILPSKKDQKRGFRTSTQAQKEEYAVEAIMDKRFNARKKLWEYKVKWDNFDESQCTWEPPSHLHSCKNMVDDFEARASRKDKGKMTLPERSKITDSPKLKQRPIDLPNSPKFKKVESPITPKMKPKPDYIKSPPIKNEILDTSGRPQRSSKQKALDQVKAWIGNISDEESTNKRLHDDDDDSDDSFEKKMKLEAESEDTEDDEKPPVIIKKTPKLMRAISNGIGKKLPDNVLIPDAQGIVRINQKQLPSLSSGVYIMSKTAGIIKLDSQTSKIAASGGQAIVKVAPKIGQTHIRIVKKDGGSSNRILQMSTSKGSGGTPKVTKIVRTTTPKMMKKVEVREEKKLPLIKPLVKEKESASIPLAVEEEESDGVEELEFPADLPIPEPESPPGEFVLDPLTGKIAGQEYPDPEPEIEPESELNKDNGETAESTLDNIVKLAAEGITEDDLKPEPLMDASAVIESEDQTPMEVDKDSGEQLLKEEKAEVDEKMSEDELEEGEVVKKVFVEAKMKSPKSILTSALSNSNILERTLQTATPRLNLKSPQRILNESVSTRISPMVKPIMRTHFSGLSKTKHIMPKQRIYMSSPSSRFNESIIRQTYSKSNTSRRVGNIGTTSIYKRTPPSSIKPSPRFISRTNIVRRPATGHGLHQAASIAASKSVISMPSLTVDDEEEQQQQQQHQEIAQLTEATVVATAVEPTAPAAASVTTEADLSSFTLNDNEAPIFITGDDGTVYQVAGQNEQGQTILITQGPDGQQQCLLVTNEAVTEEGETTQQTDGEQTEEQQQPEHVEEQQQQQEQEETQTQVVEDEAEEEQPPSVPTEQPLMVKTEQDTSDQVVAQVVRAEPPSPGGTHKVVVMLPDGNLMVTQVTPEEYASLELDK